jgi:hypothetical protein
MRQASATAACVFILALWPSDSPAQEHVGIRADLLFYGDNTEFRNAFREGETIFGAALRVEAVVDLNDRVSFSAGGFGNQRFGSADAFEQVRPVLALAVRGRRSVFHFGTLPSRTPEAAAGPDRGGPHGLLPPLQRETLSFDRPYEAGLAWSFNGSRLQHAFWLEWQRINTVQHRERFDGGVNTSLRVSKFLSLPVQLHIVHEGGQLHSAGAVADSGAAAAGVNLEAKVGPRYHAVLEVFALASRDVPDRSQPHLSTDGTAFFGRASVEGSGWRGHIIFWRGRNFIKDEGDPNYLSRVRSGERYRGTRDYSEAGVTRRFSLAPGATLDIAGRIHRVENRYEYSFRVLSVVSKLWKVR